MGTSATGWSRAEIEEAFVHQQQVVREIGQSWDWSRYADLFAEDATQNEHTYGKMAGREQIREWIVAMRECVKRCQACGTLTDDGAAFAKNMGWPLA